MAVEEEVRATLEIERTGEPEAIANTAQDLRDLGQAAQEAAGQVSQISAVEERLSALQSSVAALSTELPNLGAALRQAFGDDALGSGIVARLQQILELAPQATAALNQVANAGSGGEA